MNLKMGSQTFINVQIPLLWGDRAVLQDLEGRISVIDLSGDTPNLEIVGDKPAPGIEFLPTVDGYQILSNGEAIYNYNPNEKILISISLGLPNCEIGINETRVGNSIFSNNMIIGFDIGIAVGKKGISLGGPVPPGLAELKI
jgi:hypothetical protein